MQLLPHGLQGQSGRFPGLAKTSSATGRSIKSVHSLVINHNASTPGIRCRILRKFVMNSLQIATGCHAVAKPRLDLRRKL